MAHIRSHKMEIARVDRVRELNTYEFRFMRSKLRDVSVAGLVNGYPYIQMIWSDKDDEKGGESEEEANANKQTNIRKFALCAHGRHTYTPTKSSLSNNSLRAPCPPAN